MAQEVLLDGPYPGGLPALLRLPDHVLLGIRDRRRRDRLAKLPKILADRPPPPVSYNH